MRTYELEDIAVYIRDDVIHISLNGEMCFCSSIGCSESLKRRVGQSMWLDVGDRLKVIAEIDDVMNDWRENFDTTEIQAPRDWMLIGILALALGLVLFWGGLAWACWGRW